MELRTALFYHSSKRFRDIYGDIYSTYQVEISVHHEPCCYTWWANLTWFYEKEGTAECSECDMSGQNCVPCPFPPKTKITTANLSFGIKFPFKFTDCFNGYVGLGPLFGGIWIDNNILFDSEEDVSRFIYGAIIKTGVQYYFCQCWFLDLFADYSYQHVNFDTDLDVGGLQLGVGVGYRF